MKSINEFSHTLNFLFTDIDDTMTDHGLLGVEAYEALWNLKSAGVQVIPVTGRPAGWCELIARQWPVSGVVGENGGFYFRYHQKKMHRFYANTAEDRKLNQQKLKQIELEILRSVPGTALASDQFCRMMDLAIDFCEDVSPLPNSEIAKIKDIFEKHGAQAKISSIHVNGWFGDYDKLSQSVNFVQQQFGLKPEECKSACGFVGDSPNDEPMWEFFPFGFGVANIINFKDQIKFTPNYVSKSVGGKGFAEIAQRIIKCRNP